MLVFMCRDPGDTKSNDVSILISVLRIFWCYCKSPIENEFDPKMKIQ